MCSGRDRYLCRLKGIANVVFEFTYFSLLSVWTWAFNYMYHCINTYLQCESIYTSTMTSFDTTAT